MLLAYMLMNFELQQLSCKAESRWFGSNALPPKDVRMQMRGRDVKSSAGSTSLVVK